MKEQKEKYNLPESWCWVTIGDLGIVVSGGTPSTKEPLFWGNEINWITPADLSGNKEKYISKGGRYISQIGLDNSSAYMLPKGSLLFSSRAPIGYMAISQNELATNQGFKNLIPLESSYVDYIYYYLQFSKESILSRASGTTFPELSATAFRSIPIPLPPLKEQIRIVFKLEEILSSLEKSNVQLDLSFNKLNLHKRTFFRSLLERKMSSTSFVERKFEDCVINCNNKRIALSSSVRKGRTGKYRYYGATGVIDYIDDYIFDGKYLLLGEDGANLLSKAKDLSFIVEGKFWVNNHAHIVQVKEHILIEYLSFYFNSLDITEYVTGTAQPKLNQANLNRIPILIPSFDEQLAIVEQMQQAFSIIEETEKVIKKVHTQIDLFRQTILNKAFTGKLVEQDPVDQQVSVLLDQLKAEKEKYLVKEKEKKNNSIKIKIMLEKSKSILEILNENKKPIPSKQLWLASDKKDDIEEFYAELKKFIESGDIVELPRNGRETFLKLADKS
ncbi:restriction endonuclease subunit S [Chryseobacterium sp. WLY505]|uniref:restriction endonuclease subunit S n=1 Tax=Chryseobacterium sp. WLY505 TaxID=3068892 RepID=UPI00279682E0|nr:restriction endonuclease subunit S [Chryseobacterium sp. WLY505]MDQ1857771.1 restriction endonuclease subunit S [Chryseobacterium sp. WLY505]